MLLILILVILIFGCEKSEHNESINSKHCKEVLDAHIKLWDSLYAKGGVSDANYNRLMKDFKLEYDGCMNKH